MFISWLKKTKKNSWICLNLVPHVQLYKETGMGKYKWKEKVIWMRQKTADSQGNSSVFSAHRSQNNVHNRLLRAANRHLHGDAVGQSQAGPDQCVVIASEHSWEPKRAKSTAALSLGSNKVIAQSLTCKKEDVRVLVFWDFVRAFARLHSQKADDVADCLCSHGNGETMKLLTGSFVRKTTMSIRLLTI